jgi:hypothetical protein
MLIILALACNLPNKAAPEAEQATLVAQTLTAIAVSQSPTPSFTPLPTLTPTLAFTSTPIRTATPSYPYVTLSQSTNCRIGPAINYDLVDTFVPGQTIEVLAMNPIGDYWYVRSPNTSSVFCWMWGRYATGGNLFNVAVFTPPPSPTPTPEYDVSFASVETCVGWAIRLRVVNTGPTTFKSLNYFLKDKDTTEAVSESKNTFEEITGCLTVRNIDNLDPGIVAWVTSNPLSNDPAGHKLTLDIKLCTGESLGGACTEKTLNFRP